MSHCGPFKSLLVAALVTGALPLVLASAASASVGPDSFGYRAITSGETYGPHAGPFTSIAATVHPRTTAAATWTNRDSPRYMAEKNIHNTSVWPSRRIGRVR